MCRKTNGAMTCPSTALYRCRIGRAGWSTRQSCLPFPTSTPAAATAPAPTDWLVVSHYNEDGTTGADSLYNPTTGEELTGYQQYTGTGTVSLYNNGRYQLVDLVSTEQSAVLCEYDQPIRYYVPGAAVTEPDASTPEMAGRYLFHDLLTGEEKDLYDANTDDATLAIYAVDGTVRVFDLQTGVLLTDTTIDRWKIRCAPIFTPRGTAGPGSSRMTMTTTTQRPSTSAGRTASTRPRSGQAE